MTALLRDLAKLSLLVAQLAKRVDKAEAHALDALDLLADLNERVRQLEGGGR